MTGDAPTRMTGDTPTRALLVMNHKSGTADPDGARGQLERLGLQLTEIDVSEVEHLRTQDVEVDRVIVAGGDGSIAPVAALAAQLERPLALLPTGTANDFARTKEIPQELEQACRLAAQGSSLQPIDLAFHQDRPFLNVASTGLSVTAARRAEPLKRWLGSLAYAAGAVRAGITGKPLQAVIEVEGERVFDGWAWQVIVSNTGAFGGGAEIAADEQDAKLDVTVIPRDSRAALVRRAWGMRSGGLADQDGVVHLRGCRIDVTTSGARLYVIDGEQAAEPTKVATFTLKPGAFQLVVG